MSEVACKRCWEPVACIDEALWCPTCDSGPYCDECVTLCMESHRLEGGDDAPLGQGVIDRLRSIEARHTAAGGSVTDPEWLKSAGLIITIEEARYVMTIEEARYVMGEMIYADTVRQQTEKGT